jgi:hypothetical protein
VQWGYLTIKSDLADTLFENWKGGELEVFWNGIMQYRLEGEEFERI